MAVPVVESTWRMTPLVQDGSSSQGQSIGKPSGLTTNDLCIIVLGSENITATAQWDDSGDKPTGFTLINEAGNTTSDCHVAAFYRVIDGTEVWPVVSQCQDNDSNFAMSVRVSGVDTSTPIHQTGPDTITASAAIGITQVTTTLDDCLILAVCAHDGANNHNGTQYFTTSGTGWSETVETGGINSANECSGSVSQKDLASQGGSGTCTVTAATNQNDMAGFQFAIAPAAGSNLFVNLASSGGLAGEGGLAGSGGGLAG